MAQCIDCGRPASCSCQLVNGRCSACNYAYLNPPVQPTTTQPQPQQTSNVNVIAPPNYLCRLRYDTISTYRY